jgi:hypothetical protein
MQGGTAAALLFIWFLCGVESFSPLGHHNHIRVGRGSGCLNMAAALHFI